jgi:hypothetical protein
LKKRELDLELEELEDSFRERERQSAAQNAERASATRQRRDRELEALRERWWRERCRRYALWRLPQDAQLEVRLNLPEVMDELLSKTDRHQAWRVTRSLIDAAVAQLLGPYRRGKEIDCRIKEAVDGLPRKVKDCHQPSDWPLRAAAAARRAVRELPVDASMEEIELAVRQAVESVVHEIGKQQA